MSLKDERQDKQLEGGWHEAEWHGQGDQDDWGDYDYDYDNDNWAARFEKEVQRRKMVRYLRARQEKNQRIIHGIERTSPLILMVGIMLGIVVWFLVFHYSAAFTTSLTERAVRCALCFGVIAGVALIIFAVLELVRWVLIGQQRQIDEYLEQGGYW